MPKGVYVKTESHRKKLSEVQLKHWEEHPERRESLSESVLKYWENNPERKSKIVTECSARFTKLWADSSFREKTIKTMKERFKIERQKHNQQLMDVLEDLKSQGFRCIPLIGLVLML